MKRWYMGTAMALTCWLLATPQTRAENSGAFMGGYGGQPVQLPGGTALMGGAGFGGGGAVSGVPTPGHNPGGMMVGGMIGMGGMCGHIGFTGMGGCCGGFQIGFCGFGGCCGGWPYHCMGSMSGCFGGFGTHVNHTYSRWSPSPTKAYYFRHLHVSASPTNDTTIEFVLVHYPERPRHFYYFDSAAKVYVGRYNLGTKAETCFSLLNPPDRKAELKNIRDAAFRSAGRMPALAQLIMPKTLEYMEFGAWKNTPLSRPPKGVPSELLGLPPEEELGKKSK